MTHSNRRPRQHRRGTASVELAFLMPFLLMLLLGIWEVGRLIQINQILNNAAREGARLASTGKKTDDEVKLAICYYLQNAGLKDYSSQRDSIITVYNATEPGIDSAAAVQMDKLEITVSIPWSDVRWTTLNLITSPSSTLNAKVTWYSLEDQVYPNTVTSPAGF